MDPKKGKQEVITPNNQVSPCTDSFCHGSVTDQDCSGAVTVHVWRNCVCPLHTLSKEAEA